MVYMNIIPKHEDCDCDVEWDIDSCTMVLCDLHKAAPELLEACKMILSRYGTTGRTFTGERKYTILLSQKHLDIINSAIKKAEGR